MNQFASPATPEEDLVKYRNAAATLGKKVLTAELIELAQGGVSVILGGSGADGSPIAGIGTACRVERSGRMRVLLGEVQNEPLLTALRAGSALAVTFGRVRDHRSFQVKATSATILPASPDDQPEIARQCTVFRDELMEIGYTREIADGIVRYDTDNIIAIEFLPESAFVQTPGPGAGSALTP